jgi:leucyl aminopeptidase
MALEFSFLTKNLNQVEGSTLVVLTGKSGGDSKEKKSSFSLNLKNVPKEVVTKLSAAVGNSSYKGQVGDVLFFRDHGFLGFQNLMLVGLGDGKNFGSESLRKSASHAYRSLKAHHVTNASLALDSIPTTAKNKDALLNALFEGFYLSDYSFDELKAPPKEKDAKKPLQIQVVAGLAGATNAAKKIHASAEIVCEAVNFGRRLGDMPGNLMTPPILAQETKKAAEGSKLKVTVWDKEKIKKEKMGCLLGVSLGGGPDPRLIIMEYNGGKAKAKPIGYVGKGLTFDSGGISIKPAAAMEEMKYDMMGGASVIATMLAIAKLKLKVNAIGIVPSSENMPGPMANKPGDILTSRNGKTVEVNNTDAEGRLILSDALVYASEQNPEFIVDAATLTGAMVIALGDIHTGFFSRDNKLTQKIKRAADASGELLWEMPFNNEHLKDMKGTFADLQNVSMRRGAGSATATAFLGEFVDGKIPWAHFDIAGTAWHNGHRLPYTPARGASGLVIRTFIELAKQHAK